MQPSISPSLSSKQQGLRKRGEEEWRRNRSKPIGEQTPASSEKSPFLSLLLPFFLLQRHSHWEPAWLDVIFSSYRLTIAAQCQKLLSPCDFSTRQCITEACLLAAVPKSSRKDEVRKMSHYVPFLNHQQQHHSEITRSKPA